MSSENPTSPGAGAPFPGSPTESAQPPFGTPVGEEMGSGHDDSAGESFFGRHYAVLVAAAVAIVVAAVAIAGLAYYRNEVDARNSANEAAFSRSVAAQGATLDTVECEGDTCAAIIGGQAYTVLVQEDEDGKRHFGVSAFSGG